MSFHRYNWSNNMSCIHVADTPNKKQEMNEEEEEVIKNQATASGSPRSVAVVPDVIQFHYDSEEEEGRPTSNPHVRLHWNMDPEVSFSDWKIEISYKVKTNTTTAADIDDNADISNSSTSITTKTKLYHVHKSVLAVGARRSEYFARLFHTNNTYKDNISQIELEPCAAEAFPIVLDYLYCPERCLQVNSQNAAPLHYLGSYLEMKQLRWDSRKFWKEDLTVDTLSHYYRHATLFDDEKLLDAVVDVCAREISHVLIPDDFPCDFENHIVRVASEPSFWLRVLAKYNKDWPDYQSLHVSKLMSHFCESYKEMDAATFNQIVDPDHLPCIATEVAFSFLQLEAKFFPHSPQTEVVTELSDLQLRCVESLAFSWPCIDVSDGGDTKVLLKTLSPLFLSELLTRSLARAQMTNTLLQNQVQTLTCAKEMLEQKNAKLKRANSGASLSNLSTTPSKAQTTAQQQQSKKEAAGTLLMEQQEDRVEI
mmetsp:Transcript_9006/g.14013  ORF Transcript_9006/g.14013 Transcript_9006/m.14013 type:complete len:481 (-) Transcript_9006:149-1591(-)